MATAAPGLAEQAGGSGRDRLVESVPGLGERARQKGGEKTGKNPTDRGKPGSKRHLVSDRGGVPLAVVLTAANVHDSKAFEELLDEIEPIRRPAGEPGRPRKRPAKLHADEGYDFPRCRKALRERGIKARIGKAHIARMGKDTSERLGRHRWVVERTLAWLARSTGFRCATRGGPTSTRRSSISVAHSSASTTYRVVLQCTLSLCPDAATAGFSGGYDSPSQFSREYGRLFGAPPLRDTARLKSLHLQQEA